MSDEQKRIEELEQQLKIAKLEKELAEMKSEKLENQKNTANKENSSIEEIITNYINQRILKSDCILVGDKLTDNIIAKSGMRFDNNEKPLLLLYKQSLFFDLKTRILITDKNIYFKALPDTFLIGLTCNFAKKIEGKFSLQNINCLEIGEHDHAFGTAYIGHQLKINNDIVGLIRMGTSTEYDEEAIKYLNGLFDCMTNNKTIKVQTETKKQTETAKKRYSQDDASDSGWTIVWKLCLAVIGAIFLCIFFPDMFSDRIVITNTITGEEIEFPVETINVDGQEEYCIKVSILEGKEHRFCSKDKDSLTNFITKVKQNEARAMVEDTITTSLYTATFATDKMIYGPLKMQYNVYERDLEETPQEESKLDKAIMQYKKAMAKERNISLKCYEDYQNILDAEGYVSDENMPCSKRENKAIKDYLKKISENYDSNTYYIDGNEPLYSNNGMPKSLVLKGVSIECFEKANMGDNKKCSSKELDTIRTYFKENEDINWGEEYFKYK